MDKYSWPKVSSFKRIDLAYINVREGLLLFGFEKNNIPSSPRAERKVYRRRLCMLRRLGPPSQGCHRHDMPRSDRTSHLEVLVARRPRDAISL